jgi:hypothetical protein
MKNKLIAAGLVLASYSSLAVAAPVTHTFDTVTGISMHRSAPSLTGVLRNTTTPVTISWADETNISYRFIVSRCVPIFLTMIEKPGRYFLSITIDPADTNVSLISCDLELRS